MMESRVTSFPGTMPMETIFLTMAASSDLM